MEATPQAIQPMNVRENWPIYDTVQIRSDATEKEGYKTFQALAAVDDVPFFTIRKKDVGLAYTNRESNESLEFAYRLKSIGVSIRPHFSPTPSRTMGEGGEVVGIHNPLSSAILADLINHCGLILRIREDEKLINTLSLTPDGTGSFSIIGATPVAGAQSVQANPINGWPDNRNRYTWSGEGLAMPRGATFSVVLRFSTYAKRLLACLPNPGMLLLNKEAFAEEPPKDCEVPAAALIRVSLEGWREVQQRGALHI